MKTFDDGTAYLSALKADAALAIIPFQMAADALDVTRAAVERRVRSGELEGVTIGKTRAVLAASLNAELETRRADVDTVEGMLVDLACKRETTVYGPVMAAIGLRTQVPAHRRRIGMILGKISEKSYEGHDFMLSALVFNKTAGRPSDSFYGLGEQLDEDYANGDLDNEEFLAKQLKMIFAYYGPRKSKAQRGTGKRGR